MWPFRYKKDLRELITEEEAGHAGTPPSNINEILVEGLRTTETIKNLEDQILELEEQKWKLEDSLRGFKKNIASYLIDKAPLEIHNPDWTNMIGTRKLKIGDVDTGIFYYKISNCYVEMILFAQNKESGLQVTL